MGGPRVPVQAGPRVGTEWVQRGAWHGGTEGRGEEKSGAKCAGGRRSLAWDPVFLDQLSEAGGEELRLGRVPCEMYVCTAGLNKSGAWGELALEVDLGSMSTCGFINTGRRKRCGLRTSAGVLRAPSLGMAGRAWQKTGT